MGLSFQLVSWVNPHRTEAVQWAIGDGSGSIPKKGPGTLPRIFELRRGHYNIRRYLERCKEPRRKKLVTFLYTVVLRKKDLTQYSTLLS